jgi:glycosyltransferase involved in cell wall biosynthesis
MRNAVAETLENAPMNTPAAPAEWPRITMITAVYNGEKYLEATIRSIVEQSYPNLEYIVVDDGSTDGTAEIIRKYAGHLAHSIHQPNRGLYSALNAGFARSTGEVMGWLNASDRLHEKGLFVVGSVFAAFQEVEWITGRPTVFNQRGMTVEVKPLPRWSQYRFLAGANKHIQQESTFWRRSLWEKAGGKLDESFRAEGDFELWVRFFRHAQLYPVDALIGSYRFHDDALSHGNISRYDQNCAEIVARELETVRGGKWLKLFRKIGPAVKGIPKVRGLWWRLTERGLYDWAGPDCPPVIKYARRDGWFMEKK